MKVGRVQRFFQRVILSVVLTTTILAGASAPRPAEAIIPTLVSSVASDIWQIGGNILETLGNAYDKFSDQIKAQLEHAAAVAYRQGIRRFLQNLAYDSATWIASGGKGQKPLFITAGWGTYLRDHADAALGDFVDGLSQEIETGGSCSCVGADGVGFSKSASSESECTGLTSGPEQCTWQPEFSSGLLSGLNLCQPPSDVLLRINLGVAPAGEQVNRPRCTASQIFNNWQRSITERDFLPRFQSTFDPSQNPLAVALNIHALGQERSFKAEQAAKEKRQESSGFLGVEGLDGEVYTPSSVVRDFFTDTLNASKGGELEYTGDVIADAIDIFTNTLVSNVLNNLISKGLSGGSGPDSPRRRAAGPTLTNPEAVNTNEGVAGARIRLARDIAPKFSVPGQYDALSILVSCRNQTNPGPNTCAITENMRTAISQRMVVREAIEAGLFNSDGAFAFTFGGAQPVEPSYTDGIPFRTILLLRKYRIIPSGWEVAARYVQHFETKQVTLREIASKFDDPTSPYYRLVDPEWPLVKPDAYCKLQGPGPEIVGKETAQGVDTNKDGKYDSENETPPTLRVTRAEYCADEQTCIKKDEKGNCQFYGYCTEEKRVWNFNSSSCNAVFNTCTTLERARDGSTVSYLLNTVNEDSCNEQPYPDGCKQYSRVRNLNVQNDKAPDYWSGLSKDSVFLNGKVSQCGAADAGCRAFIRTGISMPLDALPGVNLVVNPSFERLDNGPGSEWSTTPAGSVLDTASYDGKNGYWTTGGDTLSQVIETGKVLGPSVYQVSFFAKRSVAGGTVQLNVPSGVVEFVGTNTSTTPAITNSWQQYVATVTFDSTVTATSFDVQLQIPGQTAIDAVKVTPGVTGAAYTPYGVGISNASLYLKRAPEYLSGRLATGSYFGGGRSCRPTRPADNTDDTPDQAECKPYARYCLPEEAGCLSYAPTNKGTPITSVRGDTCPAECVGYDTYTQSKTFFEPTKFVDLIPNTARKCPAARVGCDEFTNLDIEQRGGEAKEYYQELRLCRKPSVSPTTNGVYYTWEGSDRAGYQLKVHQLVTTNASSLAAGLLTLFETASDISTGNAVYAPCTNARWGVDEKLACDEDLLLTLSRNSLVCNNRTFGANPDCREFYDASGNVTYRLLSKTITVTDNCIPYRKTQVDADGDCRNSGGLWKGEQCFFDAIPKQGKSCPASAAGCREYRGGSSANYRVLLNDTFENGSAGWSGGTLSAVSSNVGGHSYEVSGAVRKKFDFSAGSQLTLPEEASVASYIWSAWVRLPTLPGGSTLTVKAKAVVGGVAKEEDLYVGAVTSDEWVFLQADPKTLPFAEPENAPTDMRIEVASSAGVIYIDNIQLKSNINTHYLIKSSSRIPQSCDSPVQYLGCQQYKVSDGKTRNIYQFGNACHQKVVGCEALIDTQNTTTGLDAAVAKTYGNHYEGYCSLTPSQSCDPGAADPCGNGDSCVTNLVVPADSIDFLVNAKDKQCKKEAQGCELLGLRNARLECPNVFDIALLIDDSDSISSGNFATLQRSARELVSLMKPSSDGNHVGVVAFSSTARKNPSGGTCSGDSSRSCTPLTQTVDCDDDGNPGNGVRFGTCSNGKFLSGSREDIQAAVLFPQSRGSTNLADGFAKVGEIFASADARSGVPKLVVVFTDGSPNGGTGSTSPSATAAAALKQQGVQITTIGIGLTNITTLFLRNVIASSQQAAFTVSDFDGLSYILPDILSASCSLPASWQAATVINNPDTYGDVLCREEQLDCELYRATSGSKITEWRFKDPGSKICEYRSDKPLPGWYIVGVDAVAPNCDKPSEQPPRTFAAGGVQETKLGWVGQCAVVDNSCREYYDPRSDDGKIYTYNGSFIVLENSFPKNWEDIPPAGGTSYIASNHSISIAQGGVSQKRIAVPSRTSYVLNAEARSETPDSRLAVFMDAVCVNRDGSPVQLLTKNGDVVNRVFTFMSPKSSEFERFSVNLYPISSAADVLCDVRIGRAADLMDSSMVDVAYFTSAGTLQVRNVFLREARIHYQRSAKVDSTTCGGVVDNTTCVLVDDRVGLRGDQNPRFDADMSPTPGPAKTNIPNSIPRDEYQCVDLGSYKACRGTGTSCSDDDDCQLQLDSTSLVKVSPDRECAAWLSCRTAQTVRVGSTTKNVCLEVESCEGLSDAGVCSQRSLDYEGRNLLYDRGSVDLMRNKSGFSKVGFDWDFSTGGAGWQKNRCEYNLSKTCSSNSDCNTSIAERCVSPLVQGNLPQGRMTLAGEPLQLLNGNFEIAGRNGNPTGWLGWADGVNMRVIDNPVTAGNLGVRYPMEGRKFLEVNAVHPVPGYTPSTEVAPNYNLSNYIRVSPDTKYVLSAYINTLYFTGKEPQCGAPRRCSPSVEVRVYEYTEKLTPVTVANGLRSLPRADDPGSVFQDHHKLLNLGPSHDWTLRSDEFTTASPVGGTATAYIRLQFAWNDEAQSDGGRWYIDDLKIRPALEYQKNERYQSLSYENSHIPPDFPLLSEEYGRDTYASHYAPSSCRLYPKEDALSCSYVDDAGNRQRGVAGYCLEWDSRNTDYCLTWWPVDSDTGNSEESVGYSDRTPLYYCAEATMSLEQIPDTIDRSYVVNTKNGRINRGKLLDQGVGDSDNELKYFELKDNQRDAIGYPSGICLGPAYSLGGGGKHKWCKASHNFPYCGRVFCLTPQDALLPEDAGKYWAPGDISGLADPLASDIGSANDLKATSSRFEIWSLHKAMVRAGFSSASIQRSGNRFEFWVLIDRETNDIKRFIHMTLDDDNNTSNFWFPDGIRYLKSHCSTVVQTVTPDGTNKAWLNRMSSTSGYIVPYLQYAYGDDFAPFGGIVAPEPQDVPEEWDSREGQFKQPLFLEIPDKSGFKSPPYQVRAGSPYACKLPSGVQNFACAAPSGKPISASQPSCLSVRDVSTGLVFGRCKHDTNILCDDDSLCASEGICLGDQVTACRNKLNPDPACTGRGPALSPSVGDSNGNGVCDVWEVGCTLGQDGRCLSGLKIGQGCRQANNTLTEGVWVDENGNGVKDYGEDANRNGNLDLGEDTNNNGDLDTEVDIYLANPDCPGGTGEPLAECVAPTFCEPSYCDLARRCFQPGYSGDNTVCIDDAQCLSRAGAAYVGGGVGSRSYEVTSGPNIDGESLLKTLFVETYGVWDWSGGVSSGQYNLSSTRGWAPPATNCPGIPPVRPKGCSATGGNCVDNSQCVRDERNDDLNENGIRDPGESLGSNGVFDLPADLNGNGDIDVLDNSFAQNICVFDTRSYCLIPPTIPQTRLSSSSVVGIGYVTLDFAAVVDGDQAPIVRYEIDWKDGSKTVRSNLSLQSRPSMTNALSVSHNYVFDDVLRNSSGSCSDTNGDGVKDRCIVSPTVTIFDNWSAKSGSVSAGTITLTP